MSASFLLLSSPPIPDFLHVCSVSPSLTFPPSPLHTHLTPPLSSPHPPPTRLGVCSMGHWCDMHLSLQFGNTPLMWASWRGRDGCVQLLLDRGALIDHQNVVSAFRDQPSVGSQWCRKYGGCGENCPQIFIRGRVLPPTPTVIP